MSTQTAEKIYKEVKALRKETEVLKELFFLFLKDPEGEYKDSFIKRILSRASSRPRLDFGNKKDFLNSISS